MNIYINWQEIMETTIQISLSLLCGGVLGIERGRKKRPAGPRTYMLVCLGATLVMMTNCYICETTGSGDITRMGAQVVSGIGFLGAGTIITTGHNRVKGLTTAAGLWSTACIGLAIGCGYYAGAIVGTFMIFVVMVTLHSLDNKLTETAKTIIMYVEFEDIATLHRLNEFTKNNKIVVSDIEMEMQEYAKASRMAAVVTMKLSGKWIHADLIDKISALEGVIFVEELQ